VRINYYTTERACRDHVRKGLRDIQRHSFIGAIVYTIGCGIVLLERIWHQEPVGWYAMYAVVIFLAGVCLTALCMGALYLFFKISMWRLRKWYIKSAEALERKQ